MAVKEITKMGNPVLRDAASPVLTEEICSEEFKLLLKDMEETMISAGGVGIAAPQINVSKQVALIKIDSSNPRYPGKQNVDLHVFINPKITYLTHELQGFWEACLSVPGLKGYVERPKHIKVDYLDAHGEEKTMEADGFMAIVLQHELDHLHGKLYVDKVMPGKLVFDAEFEQFVLPKISE